MLSAQSRHAAAVAALRTAHEQSGGSQEIAAMLDQARHSFGHTLALAAMQA